MILTPKSLVFQIVISGCSSTLRLPVLAVLLQVVMEVLSLELEEARPSASDPILPWAAVVLNCVSSALDLTDMVIDLYPSLYLLHHQSFSAWAFLRRISLPVAVQKLSLTLQYLRHRYCSSPYSPLEAVVVPLHLALTVVWPFPVQAEHPSLGLPVLIPSHRL
jgi:hypothetical protein